MLRKAMADGTPLGRQVKPIYDRGDLVPDDLMIELIRAELEGHDGYVLDGFPRTLPQAEALDVMLDEIGKPGDAVILLQVSDGVATARLQARAAAEGRADDSPEAISNRLRLYHERTEPVVERYRAEGTLLTVEGEGTVEDVASDIEDALASVGARSR
jgi:adenylate kinase